jgi:hypothetical protein
MQAGAECWMATSEAAQWLGMTEPRSWRRLLEVVPAARLTMVETWRRFCRATRRSVEPRAVTTARYLSSRVRDMCVCVRACVCCSLPVPSSVADAEADGEHVGVSCGVSDCACGRRGGRRVAPNTVKACAPTRLHAMSTVSMLRVLLQPSFARGGTDVEASFNVVGNVPVGVLAVQRQHAVQQRYTLLSRGSDSRLSHREELHSSCRNTQSPAQPRRHRALYKMCLATPNSARH